MEPSQFWISLHNLQKSKAQDIWFLLFISAIKAHLRLVGDELFLVRRYFCFPEDMCNNLSLPLHSASALPGRRADVNILYAILDSSILIYCTVKWKFMLES
jgi:hypothetical protein